MRTIQFLGSLILLSTFLSTGANASVIGEILKDSSGKIELLTPYQGETRCAALGGRLPRASDYAELGRARGAIVKESNFPNLHINTHSDESSDLIKEMNQMEQQGFLMISKRVPGTGWWVVDFYYKSANYKAPPNTPNVELHTLESIGYPHRSEDTFWESTGNFGSHGPATYLYVRCAFGK